MSLISKILDIMTNERRITTRKIAGTGLLFAIMIILQLIGNHVSIGPVSINLSLIPIAIGAIIYGPLAGLFLGAMNGLFCIFAPATLSLFIPISVPGTILTCLLKTSLAGFISGFIYKLLNKKNKVLSIILASLIVPIINTGVFALFSMTIFRSLLLEMSSDGNIYSTLFIVMIGWNFVLEFGVTSLLSPIIVRIVNIYSSRNSSELA